MDQEITRDNPLAGVDKDKHFADKSPVTTWGNLDDKVYLVIVTPHNYVYCGPMTRQKASDEIRNWFNTRCWVLEGPKIMEEGNAEKIKEHESAKHFLKYCTFASNVGTGKLDEKGNEETIASWAVGYEHIIGMYVKEICDHGDLIKAQEEFFKASKELAQKELRDRKKNDEWKGDDEQP